MLPQSEFGRDLKTHPLSLQAIDIALGFLMYYSCSCSFHKSHEIRYINSQGEEWLMIWYISSQATMMHSQGVKSQLLLKHRHPHYHDRPE